ncbi:hypothetical protein V8J82_18920 [Gymnodinialimonas sp. 2305UL16-5]|uniref:hypothetical protein n=1 Tax=Gymnodinialimonas mytili TaxID=3126503 RepID=UPI0030B3ACD4
MPLGRFGAACAVAIVVTGPAWAQTLADPATFLTREALEAHMSDSAFCYYPSDRLSCAWAELYTELNDDHAILHSANASADGPMQVIEFRVDWRDNGLCVDYDTQGLIAAREADGNRFPFDLSGLEEITPEALEELLVLIRDNSTPDSCFYYSEDPITPGQLRQHAFYGGVQQEGFDPVALIPSFASGVSMNPG